MTEQRNDSGLLAEARKSGVQKGALMLAILVRRLISAFEAVTAERDSLRERNAGIRELHGPVEIELGGTICSECSFQLRNGRYFGKVTEFPCATVQILAEKETGGNAS